LEWKNKSLFASESCLRRSTQPTKTRFVFFGRTFGKLLWQNLFFELLEAKYKLGKYKFNAIKRFSCTFASNGIEGNTLTLKETKVVLEGITIGGKSTREHFEVINHEEAVDYVEAVITDDEAFSERLIKAIHQLVLKNIDSDNADVYRHENVLIAGAEHRPPDFLHVPEQMVDLVQAYEFRFDESGGFTGHFPSC
jgi:Fic family protein